MRRPLELALAGLLIAAGAVSAFLYATVFIDPVNPDDWDRAAAHITKESGERDLVRIEPTWFDRGLVALRPVGDRVQRIRQPLVEDLLGVNNVYILSDSSRVPEAKAALPFPGEFDVVEFGTATVLRTKVPPSGIIWELRENLADAKVARVRGDEVEQCTRWNSTKRRWDCKKPSRWTYVGAVEREVGDEPRECVWAHPLDRGRTLRIEAEVPPADTIRVRDSFDLRAARLGGAPVLMQVFVNDDLKVEDRVAGNDHDWQAHDIDVSNFEGATRLRIEVDLLGKIKNRFFCINAWALNEAD